MKKIFSRYILVTLGFYAFWLGGMPFIFAKTVPLLSSNFSHNSDYNVEIQHPQIRLNIIPTAKFKTDKILIQQKNSNNFVILENVEAKIRILPLLSGTFHVNSFSVEKINSNLELENKIELDKHFLKKMKNAKCKCNKIQIGLLEMFFNQQGVPNPIVYKSKNFLYQKNNRLLKLNVDSCLNLKNTISSTKINLYIQKNNNTKDNVVNVEISNFNLAPLGDYLKQYIPQEIVDIKGIINVKVDNNNLDSSLKNFAIIMQENSKSIILPDVLNVKSKFNLTGKNINFENLNIYSKDVDLRLRGYISNYLDNALSSLNFNLQINSSKLQSLVSSLPPIVLEELNIHKLKQYGTQGDIIGNITVNGNVKEPEINGEIFINNGIVEKPIPRAKGATIKLDFIGKYLNFDVVVPVGSYEKVWVKGGVELYNVKYADMRIWSTKNVDLSIVQDKIIPIHEILNFIIGPVPILKISGLGNVDITVKGNRKWPHIWGSMNFNNVETYFKEMPSFVLKKAKASLVFNDQNAEFKTIEGKVDNKDFSINGNCNVFGKFNFNVLSNQQSALYLYHALKTATLAPELKPLLHDLDKLNGLLNLNLNISGEVKDITNIVFNENVFAKGKLSLLGNDIGIQNITLQKIKGDVNFDGLDLNANLTGFVGNSPAKAVIIVKNEIADLSVEIPKLNIMEFLANSNELKKDVDYIILNVKSKYKGNINKIEFDKIDFVAKVINSGVKNKIAFTDGEIVLKNNKLQVASLKGIFPNQSGSLYLDIVGNNIVQKPVFNGKLQLHNFDLTLCNSIKNYSIFTPQVSELLQKFEFNKGNINLNSSINNNKINMSTNLANIEFSYVPYELPIKILNGNLNFKNNTLGLNKINLLADNMPILVDGYIQDVVDQPYFNMYINSKPQQDFIDKYINRNQIYPIKIKGDIIYSAKFKGKKDNYDLKSVLNMSKDSSVYYLGAMVGDVENAIVLNLDTKVLNQNSLNIKEFSYDKLISSQSGRQTRLNMLKSKGGIDILKDDLDFHNLHIKTQNPTDARIFNIIFRKPNIKQGQFTSDLLFNGKLSDPKLIGSFRIFETNIPFLDTTMKNISFIFKEKTIELQSIGEVLGNDITFKGRLKNKLTLPYYVEDAEIYTKVLDLNNVVNKLKHSQLENAQTFEALESVDVKNIVVKNLRTKADRIHLRNIIAEKFEATSSLSENHVLDINDFKFLLANGFLRGSFKYNLDNYNTELAFNAKDINANDLSYALFDLNNQIYGDLTGTVSLTCNGESFENCMKTLNGDTNFNVANGRIPKLGSLEYLLKAGNLIKGGFTGVSINSIIDIITPLKTGEFASIYGTTKIKDGVAENIEIASQGNDLSLFISGKYNFSDSMAEMVVLGMLSRKISTMFGPLGNVSINTLFNIIPGIDLTKDSKFIEQINKIPGIELSNKAFRKFVAVIKGDINGENYVTSFKWIN